MIFPVFLCEPIGHLHPLAHKQPRAFRIPLSMRIASNYCVPLFVASSWNQIEDAEYWTPHASYILVCVVRRLHVQHGGCKIFELEAACGLEVGRHARHLEGRHVLDAISCISFGLIGLSKQCDPHAPYIERHLYKLVISAASHSVGPAPSPLACTEIKVPRCMCPVLDYQVQQVWQPSANYPGMATAMDPSAAQNNFFLWGTWKNRQGWQLRNTAMIGQLGSR